MKIKMPPRAAVRWILNGKHDGWGIFGPPTGANVCILGASHVEFGHHGIQRIHIVLIMFLYGNKY